MYCERIMNEIVRDHYIKNRLKYIKQLHNVCGGIFGAEDVLHDSYERVLKYYSSFNGEDFDRWVSVIVKNALRDYLKAERGHTTITIDEFEYEGAVCLGYYGKVYDEVNAIINSKPTHQAEILRLHFQHDMSAIDISRIMDEKYKTIHQIISRFREEMKELYKDK